MRVAHDAALPCPSWPERRTSSSSAPARKCGNSAAAWIFFIHAGCCHTQYECTIDVRS